MRVLCTGSRKWHDRKAIQDRLFDLPVDSTIVVGFNADKDTPKGADRLVYQEAQKLGLAIETHPADWTLGKGAGYIRNQQMVDAGADLCLAFWDGLSRGTQHTIAAARKAGIPVEIVWKEGGL